MVGPIWADVYSLHGPDMVGSERETHSDVCNSIDVMGWSYMLPSKDAVLSFGCGHGPGTCVHPRFWFWDLVYGCWALRDWRCVGFGWVIGPSVVVCV